jgi:hypothetical protein
VLQEVLDRLLAVDEEVEQADAVAAVEQAAEECRADVAGAADDQDGLDLAVAGEFALRLGADDPGPEPAPEARRDERDECEDPAEEHDAAGDADEAAGHEGDEAEDEVGEADGLGDDEDLEAAAVGPAAGVEAAEREGQQADRRHQRGRPGEVEQILQEHLVVRPDMNLIN